MKLALLTLYWTLFKMTDIIQISMPPLFSNYRTTFSEFQVPTPKLTHLLSSNLMQVDQLFTVIRNTFSLNFSSLINEQKKVVQ